MSYVFSLALLAGAFYINFLWTRGINMRAFIIGFEEDGDKMMEKYYLIRIPPMSLLKKLFWEGQQSITGADILDGDFPVRLHELVFLEPYMLHKADHFRLGRLEYSFGFEASYNGEVVEEDYFYELPEG